MLMLASIAIVIGATLGLRFKVWILLPAITLAALAILANSIAYASAILTVIAMMVYAIVGLQIGYVFGGVVLRAIVCHFESASTARKFKPLK